MKRIAFALLALCVPGTLTAQEAPRASADAPKDAATPAQSAPPAAMSHHPAAACAEAKVDCAATAVPAFAKDGRLWVAFSVGKSLYAAASSDNGATFSAPTAIATVGDGVIDAHGDARPKIVALKDGTLLASYTTRPDKQMIGTIFTARSTDGGKTFSAPQALLSRRRSALRQHRRQSQGAHLRRLARQDACAQSQGRRQGVSRQRRRLRLFGRRRQDLQRQVDPDRSRLRMLPHVERAR